MSFDYSAPAELFLAKRTENGRGNYWRFSTAAEALNSIEIQRLYEADDYPLRKPE